MSGSSRISPPLQARSRAALERLVVAAEALLRERSFESLPLSLLLKRARVSVGSFYARFEGKDAFLAFLHTRYVERAEALSIAVLDPKRFDERELDATLRLLCRYLVAVYRRNRGLLRVVWLERRSNPDSVTDEMLAVRQRFLDRVARFFEPRGASSEAALTTFSFLTAICRDSFLPTSRSVALAVVGDERDFADELAALALARLTGSGRAGIRP
ncbi:MAG: TetR/AcrR family transcriptional regulator [Planctomycetota bacterium]